MATSARRSSERVVGVQRVQRAADRHADVQLHPVDVERRGQRVDQRARRRRKPVGGG
jgi:hypothetical protein